MPPNNILSDKANTPSVSSERHNVFKAPPLSKQRSLSLSLTRTTSLVDLLLPPLLKVPSSFTTSSSSDRSTVISSPEASPHELLELENRQQHRSAKPSVASSSSSASSLSAPRRTLRRLSAVESATEVCYLFSDIVFGYPVVHDSSLAGALGSLAQNQTQNCVGEKSKVVLAGTRSGAGGAAVGAALAGEKVSLCASSAALPLLHGSLSQLTAAGLPSVLHLSMESLSEQGERVISHDSLQSFPLPDWVIIGSKSPQEAYDVSVIAHVAAQSYGAQICHSFDGAVAAEQISNVASIELKDLARALYKEKRQAERRDPLTSSGRNVQATPLFVPPFPVQGGAQGMGKGFSNENALTLTDKVSGAALVSRLDRLMETMEDFLGQRYRPFEYLGAADAQTVILALTSSVTVAEEVVRYLTTTGQKVGVVHIRVPQPWSSSHFAAAMPGTVRSVVLLNRGDDNTGSRRLFENAQRTFHSCYWPHPSPCLLKESLGADTALELQPRHLQRIFYKLSEGETVLETYEKGRYSSEEMQENTEEDEETDEEEGAPASEVALSRFYRMKQVLLWRSTKDQATDSLSAISPSQRIGQTEAAVTAIAEKIGLFSQQIFRRERLHSSDTHDREKGERPQTLADEAEVIQLRISEAVPSSSPYFASDADFVCCLERHSVHSLGEKLASHLKERGILLLDANLREASAQETLADLPRSLRKCIQRKRLQVALVDIEQSLELTQLSKPVLETLFVCEFVELADLSLVQAILNSLDMFRFSGEASAAERRNEAATRKAMLQSLRKAVRSIQVFSSNEIPIENEEEGQEAERKTDKSSQAAGNNTRPSLVPIPGAWDLMRDERFSSWLGESSAPVGESKTSSRKRSLDRKADTALAWLLMFPELLKSSVSFQPGVITQLTVSKWERLTPPDYHRNVFHVELDIPEGALTYAIGEALAVHGHNDEEKVREFLQWYGVDPEQLVRVPRKTGRSGRGQKSAEAYDIMPALRLFQQVVDIFGKPSKKLYQALAEQASNAEEKRRLELLLAADGKEEYKKRQEETWTVADVLREFPSAELPLLELVKLAGPIEARHYSIASSSLRHPDQVHLLVVTHDWQTPSGRYRVGQCTDYLQSLRVGQKVSVSKCSSVLKLPQNPADPVIMAGLGTGMAPFRAFLQERATQKERGVKVGPMYLYFGSRYKAKEYLYGQELEQYAADGLLTGLRCAFSRDGPEKVYIQHHMKEDKDLLGSLLTQRQAAFYLCGPTWPAADVREALVEGMIASGSESKEEAGKLLDQMKDDERYILEVY